MEVQKTPRPEEPLSNAQVWARRPILLYEWIKQENPEEHDNWDQEYLQLGLLLSTITQDDTNIFDTFKPQQFREKIQEQRQALFTRLDWEINELQAFPDIEAIVSIRERLVRTKKNLEQIPSWKKKQKFYQARRIWYRQRDEIHKKINSDPELKSFINYYAIVTTQIWQAFESDIKRQQT